jgi:hypothetical protein
MSSKKTSIEADEGRVIHCHSVTSADLYFKCVDGNVFGARFLSRNISPEPSHVPN